MSVCTGGRLSYQYWLNGYIRHRVYAYQLIKKIAIWLIRNDLEKIREKALLAGIRKGDENGYARGFKEGRQIGYDEGKSVFVIEDKHKSRH